MIVPRITILGDTASASRWIGVAKNFARSTYQAGLATHVKKVSTDVTLKVANLFPTLASSSGISKVWIEAGQTELYYQFITTLQENSDGSDGLNGSAVAVKLPQFTAKATGSTIEVLPGQPERPLDSSSKVIARIKNVQQDELIPEPMFRYYSDETIPRQYSQLLYSWSSTPGVIFNSGLYMLTATPNITDKGYDLPPTIITDTSTERRMPDSDWPHDAAVLQVVSEDYGTKTFIVLVDASCTFHCWPTQYENGQTEYLYPPDSPYIDQAIKTNVDSSIVKTVDPAFPEWVYVPVGERRDTDWPAGSVNSGEPRYVWRFHPRGTKVVGLVLKREEFSGKVHAYDSHLEGGNVVLEYPPREVELGDVEINGTNFSNIKGSWNTYSGNLKTDYPGFVEFSINIEITGNKPEDFTFSLSYIRGQLADETHYPIAADYLNPIVGGWDKYSVSANVGDLLVLNLVSTFDSVEDLWIARNCGYLGDTQYKVRQTWARVTNIDNSNNIIKSFLIKDQPSNYDLGRFYKDAASMDVYTGKLLHIDLSKLTFTYFAKKSVFTIDPDEDGFVDGFGPQTTPYWNRHYKVFRGRQRWELSETGLRMIVFNQVVHEAVGNNGSSLSLWDDLDGIDYVNGTTAVSATLTGTRWLNYAESFLWPKNWIAGFIPSINTSYINSHPDDLYGTNLYYPWTGWIVSDALTYRISSDSDIANAFLQGMAGLSTSTTGESYTTGKTFTRNSDLIGYTWMGEEFPPRPEYKSTYTATTSSASTNIKNELSLFCSSCPENYYDNILEPWFIDNFRLWDARVISSNSDYNEETIVYIVYEGGYIVNIGPDPVGEKQYLLSTYKANDTVIIDEDYVEPDSNAFYYASINDIFYSQQPQFYSLYDGILETYSTRVPYQRIHDYPIGAEWMMTEWQNAVETDANFTLLSSPEGFYAGHCWLPYFTEKQPAHVILIAYQPDTGWNDTVPDTYPSPEVPYRKKDFYMLRAFTDETDYLVGTRQSPAYSHVVKNDLIIRQSMGDYAIQLKAFDPPSADQLAFVDCDVVGRVGGGKTSHSALYAEAYKHAMDIEPPTTKVEEKTSSILPDSHGECVYFGYVFSKGVNYSGSPLWSPVFSEIFGFMAPRKNGAMLFSK